MFRKRILAFIGIAPKKKDRDSEGPIKVTELPVEKKREEPKPFRAPVMQNPVERPKETNASVASSVNSTENSNTALEDMRRNVTNAPSENAVEAACLDDQKAISEELSSNNTDSDVQNAPVSPDQVEEEKKQPPKDAAVSVESADMLPNKPGEKADPAEETSPGSDTNAQNMPVSPDQDEEEKKLPPEDAATSVESADTLPNDPREKANPAEEPPPGTDSDAQATLDRLEREAKQVSDAAPISPKPENIDRSEPNAKLDTAEGTPTETEADNQSAASIEAAAENPNPSLENDYWGKAGDIAYFGLSRRGASHERSGTVCQDKCYMQAIEGDPSMVVAAIADGVGSRVRSDEGAAIAVQTSVNHIVNVLRNEEPTPNEESMEVILRESMQKALDAVRALAASAEQEPAHYSSTLTVAVYNGYDLYLAHIGDDGVVSFLNNGVYHLATTRHKGEESNSVYPLQSTEKWEFLKEKDVAGFVMATDGVLDTLAKMSVENNRVFYSLIEPVFLRKAETVEQIKKLQSEYDAYFASPMYRSIVRDDITFVAVVNGDTTSRKMFAFDFEKWLNQNRQRSINVFKKLYPDQPLTDEIVDSWYEKDIDLIEDLPDRWD